MCSLSSVLTGFALTLSVLGPTSSLANCSDVANHLVQSRASQGDLDAQTYLARKFLFENCSVVQQQRGLDMLLAAANSGHGPAQFDLGRLLLTEAASNAEEREALAMIGRAAQSGLIEAQEFFGLLTVERAATPEQRDEGFFWLGSAANQGSLRAAMVVYTLYRDGLHGVVADQCLAAHWAEAAHLLSEPDARAPSLLDQTCH